jgi:hypothetical protein
VNGITSNTRTAERARLLLPSHACACFLRRYIDLSPILVESPGAPESGTFGDAKSVEHPSEPIRYYPLVPVPDIDVVDRMNLTVRVTLLDAPRRENDPGPRLRSFPRPRPFRSALMRV